jgi:YidC/Oxa1 family membrane protein insertase
MVLAFVLMFLILAGTPWLYRKLGIMPAQPVNPPVKSAVATPAPAKAAAAASPAPTPAAPASQPGNATAVAAVAESEWTIRTNLYTVVFSNHGASVKSWKLSKFKDEDQKPLELVNMKGAEKKGYPFSYDVRGREQVTKQLNNALWVAHPEGDLGISYEFSDGHITAKKTLAFQRDGYMVQFADEVKLDGAPLPHQIQWRAGFGDMAVPNANGHQSTIYFDPDRREWYWLWGRGELVPESAKAAKNGDYYADGNFSFAGIQDQYFATVFLPPPNTRLQTTTFYDNVPSTYDNSDQPYPGVAVGGEGRNQFGIYVGPKEVNTLGKVNPRLEDMIDWGWFRILAKPLFLILQWMTSMYVHNYGWSIVLLTILINIALFPLRLANLKSMRKMQALQPEMNRINEKYKGISMSDPRAAQKQQETMDLYKKHGVNPVGGCVPMLIQLPFLYAFYKVLAVTIEMRGAGWLWVGDLSQPEHFGLHFLPIIMIATSFLMQKMTPMAGGDPSQQKVMQFMPLMWGVFFWTASSGLVLYWLTSNLVQIGQQWFFNKTAPPVTVIATSQKKVTSSKDNRKRT